ncbi:MAG: cbb3-type cytochrome c oxidase subunit 3 [Cyclobacteriaceae bacterium]|nr:cbb3-type cytochrome c oxidase subunit 3 [Cyclobacteriaceae bacterium]
MYKNVLQNIDHIAIWPIISFVIFFLFFIGLLWWVLTANKKYITKMSEMPLDKTSQSNSNNVENKSI